MKITSDDFKKVKFDPKNIENFKMQTLKILADKNVSFDFQGPNGVQYYSHELVRQMPFIEKISNLNEPILINGPTGTGKELIAKMIHDVGPRREQEFIPVNCGGLHEETLISELFGHVKGAFTGAVKDKKGAVERAKGGTLFLDEIGDIPMTAQVKLLRFLNDGSFQRLGSLGHDKKSDARIICATNRDLPQLIKEGAFREDLYYRINVYAIRLSAMSFPALIYNTSPGHTFDASFSRFAVELGYVEKEKKHNYKLPKLTDDALNILKHYHFPGNYRELNNVLKYAFVKCDGKSIKLNDLPDYLLNQQHNGMHNDLLSLPTDKFLAAVNELIFERLNRALQDKNGNVSATAKSFGMTNTRFERLRNRAQNGEAL